MQHADLDGDGRLDFPEFVRMARLGALRAAALALNEQQAAKLAARRASEHPPSAEAPSGAPPSSSSSSSTALRKPRRAAAHVDPAVQLHLAEMRGAEKARASAQSAASSTMQRTRPSGGSRIATSRGCDVCGIKGRDCCCGELDVGKALRGLLVRMLIPPEERCSCCQGHHVGGHPLYLEGAPKSPARGGVPGVVGCRCQRNQ